jgi:glycosyltransferase involved in cell wall biosynthesis
VEWPDFCWYSKYLPVNFHWPSLPIPLAIKFHGSHSHIANKTGQVVNESVFNVEKKHLQRSDVYSAVSRCTKEDYKVLFSIEDPVTVLYNSVPLKSFSPEERDDHRVIFSGSFVKLKGIDVLLEAWKIVHNRFPDAVLDLYGKGKLPAGHSLNRVYNHGFVDGNVLEKALRKATIAVFPSYTECFAMAPMEAMSNGCPVVYTIMGSGRELITDGVNGLLTEPGNVLKLANAITLLLKDNELRNQLSVNAMHTIAERFSLDRSVHDHLAFYKQTIAHFSISTTSLKVTEKATLTP